MKIIKETKEKFDKKRLEEKNLWKDYIEVEWVIEKYAFERKRFFEKIREFGITQKQRAIGKSVRDYISKDDAMKIIENIMGDSIISLDENPSDSDGEEIIGKEGMKDKLENSIMKI